ncbi:hypothetical protein HHI36_011030 [Cryptolaemus montrouzieri]|uniref:Lipase n=1 Tax=Cryptolaemus montrouzieri TaxID=559131 RepID=A0ABD2MKM9_9CUCU
MAGRYFEALVLCFCLISISYGLDEESLQNVEYYIPPETGMNISQLLEWYGYPFENHVVQTTDGYLLGLHRVPYGVQNTSTDPNKPVALVVHGMMSQSTDFVNNEPENSLGLLLADRGYDVWLLNCRGNTHSKRHVTLDPKKNKTKFWDFSWHEMGIYDVPETINYILNQTKQEKLFYIGHSQGTTAFFVMASMMPEYNQKIRHMTAFGPAAFMSHNEDIKYRTIARFQKEVELLALTLDIHQFMSHTPIPLYLVKHYCLEGMETYDLCVGIYYLLAGYSPTELNMTLLPVHVSNSPSGFSVKEGFHYLQGFTNGGYFRQYDYGSIVNRIKYGSPTPPEYNLTNIVCPVSLHYARKDQCVDFQDVEILLGKLPNAKGRIVPSEYFSHLDFLWGNHVRSELYDYVLEEILNY